MGILLFSHSKKYLEPLFVCTTLPLANFVPFLPLMDDVVTVTPSLKELDPKIRPAIVLSSTCFHCFNTGTPLGTTAGFLAVVTTVGFFFVLLEVLSLEAALLLLFLSVLPPTLLPPPKNPPNNELLLLLIPVSVFLAGDGCLDFTTTDDCCFLAGVVAPPPPMLPPPKRLNVGLLFFTGAAAAVGFDLLGVMPLGFFCAKNGDTAAGLVLDVGGFFMELPLDCCTADDAPPMPKMLNVGDFFLGCCCDDAFLGVLEGCELFLEELVPNRDIVGERFCCFFTTEEEEVPFATGGVALTFFLGCFITTDDGDGLDDGDAGFKD